MLSAVVAFLGFIWGFFCEPSDFCPQLWESDKQQHCSNIVLKVHVVLRDKRFFHSVEMIISPSSMPIFQSICEFRMKSCCAQTPPVEDDAFLDAVAIFSFGRMFHDVLQIV